MLNKNSILDDVTPLEFYLSQNYPNPFKDRTTIKYCVAYKTRVKLTVYDPEGEEIEKLVDEEKKPGTYEVEFSVFHLHGSLPDNRTCGNLSGEKYYYRLEAGSFKSEKKMLLIK